MSQSSPPKFELGDSFKTDKGCFIIVLDLELPLTVAIFKPSTHSAFKLDYDRTAVLDEKGQFSNHYLTEFYGNVLHSHYYASQSGASIDSSIAYNPYDMYNEKYSTEW